MFVLVLYVSFSTVSIFLSYSLQKSKLTHFPKVSNLRGKEKAEKKGWTNKLPARLSHKTRREQQPSVFTTTLQKNYKFQGCNQNRMDLRSPHRLLFVCYWRQRCPCSVAQDEDAQIGTRRWRTVSLVVHSSHNPGGNASIRGGQDWRRRVC